MTINDILHDIRLKAITEKEKGTDFERLMKLWFITNHTTKLMISSDIAAILCHKNP